MFLMGFQLRSQSCQHFRFPHILSQAILREVDQLPAVPLVVGATLGIALPKNILDQLRHALVQIAKACCCFQERHLPGSQSVDDPPSGLHAGQQIPPALFQYLTPAFLLAERPLLPGRTLADLEEAGHVCRAKGQEEKRESCNSLFVHGSLASGRHPAARSANPGDGGAVHRVVELQNSGGLQRTLPGRGGQVRSRQEKEQSAGMRAVPFAEKTSETTYSNPFGSQSFNPLPESRIITPPKPADPRKLPQRRRDGVAGSLSNSAASGEVGLTFFPWSR